MTWPFVFPTGQEAAKNTQSRVAPVADKQLAVNKHQLKEHLQYLRRCALMENITRSQACCSHVCMYWLGNYHTREMNNYETLCPIEKC